MGTKRKLPFGYKMESGRVVIDSTERSWVLHLFSRYNMGVSLRELTEFMNNTAVSYDPGKPWNKNMVARILADTRYLGESGFPVLIDTAVFLDAEEKRKKKAPAVQKTDAQTVLRRKCGCRVTTHIEHEVLYLLNCLRLREIIAEQIKAGVVFYGAGGARGFDTLAAQTVLDMKKEYPQLRLILVLPCEDQTRGWRGEDIAVYEDIKRKSDKVVYVSREYTSDCMHRRNRHLVNHSGTCICYMTRSTGGTAYTVAYARKKGLRIVNMAEECHI